MAWFNIGAQVDDFLPALTPSGPAIAFPALDLGLPTAIRLLSEDTVNHAPIAVAHRFLTGIGQGFHVREPNSSHDSPGVFMTGFYDIHGIVAPADQLGPEIPDFSRSPGDGSIRLQQHRIIGIEREDVFQSTSSKCRVPLSSGTFGNLPCGAITFGPTRACGSD
jgi:hypothetical protein